jgi:F0F1-type ATP synthase membrane subunit b/b'
MKRRLAISIKRRLAISTKRLVAISAIWMTAALAWAVLFPALAYAAEGGEEAGTWFPLIFYAINFAIFIWVLKHYAGAAIVGYFRDRSTTIRETITRAETSYHEAQERANRAAERMAKLEAEKTRIASDLADETVYQIGKLYDAAHETVARLKRDSEQTGRALQEAAQRHVRQALAHAAGHIARELLTRNFEAADQARLLDGLGERLSEEARR